MRTRRGWIHSSSLTVPVSGIITSGLTTMPRRVQSAAASKMARTCISTISGITMLRRTPRRPIIGLDSCRPLMAASKSSFSFSPLVSPLTRMVMTSSKQLFFVGHELVQRRVDQADDDRVDRPSPRTGRRNPCAGRAADSSELLGAFCAGLRPGSSSGRSAGARVSKNMCSVRHRPIPLAP